MSPRYFPALLSAALILAISAPAALADTATPPPGFEPLFNGKDLTGWFGWATRNPEELRNMSVGWFTSPDIDTPFEWCGNIGKGHPDPDIMFAEGKVHLVTQQRTDFTSPGPWVGRVEARVGVDTDNDGTINQWTGWQELKETYDHLPGFAKQIGKTPAELDLSTLPDGVDGRRLARRSAISSR